jgi:monofunctional biosynthetic peptidoglycan transglycosylase
MNRRLRRPASRRLGVVTGLVRFGLGLAVLFVVVSVLLVGLFRFVPPPLTGFMAYRHFEDWQAGRPYTPIVRRWRPYEGLSRQLVLAVVASEDQRFPGHHGFDFAAMGQALDASAHGRRLRGASTISQQVAKNLFLWPERSFLRKGLEAWFTVLLETLWSKQRIMEVYLNVAEWGDHLFGAEAASQRYFHKPAAKLGAAEAALLAASLPNPRRFRADRPTGYLLQRQQWIVEQMQHLGVSYVSLED